MIVDERRTILELVTTADDEAVVAAIIGFVVPPNNMNSPRSTALLSVRYDMGFGKEYISLFTLANDEVNVDLSQQFALLSL